MQKKERKKKSSTGKRGASRRPRRKRVKAAKVRESKAEIRETPMGYNEDTIVIMPVNTSTGFIYWEVTERLLNGSRKRLLDGSSQLTLKVFETDRRREVCSLPIKDRIGKRYVRYRASFNPLVAEIGVLRGKRFTGLLRSNPMNMHLSGENAAGDEVWMRRIRNTHKIVSVTGSKSVKKSSGLHALIMHYYHTAGVLRQGPLSSGALVKTPWSKE